jgi:choline dehydrogenase
MQPDDRGIEIMLGEEISQHFKQRKPNCRCHKDQSEDEWDGSTLFADYIILGGGTAGCVVARRLTDDMRASAIVLEAGDNNNDDPLICCTKGNPLPYNQALQLQGWNEYFWPDQTDNNQLGPLGSSNPFLERKLAYTGGRLYGGGSSINGMICIHPSKGMIKEWQEYLGGDESWSPENVGRILKKIETYNGTSQNPQVRGHHGPLQVRQCQTGATEQFIQTGLVAAAEGTNAEVVIDYNVTPLVGPDLSVCQAVQFSQFPNFKRCSSSVAWLPKTIMRNFGKSAKSIASVGLDGRRLLVLFKSTVMRILFDEYGTPHNHNRAIGVEWLHNGRVVRRVYCRRRVIVCLGIHSAQILQVSGIGPKNVLEKANVKIIAENPNIGARLIDQPLLTPTAIFPPGVVYKPTDPDALNVGIALLPDARVTLPNPPPNIDPSRRCVQMYPSILNSDTPAGIQSVVLFVFAYIKPTSTGYVRILNSDPLHMASTSYGFLSEDDRIGMRVALQVYIGKFVAQTGCILISPPALDDATVDAFILSTTTTSYHYGSSVSMGLPEKGGCTDGSGRVYGTRRLHVADNSLMPVPSDGNTQIPAYIMGYKISEDIIELDSDK